MKSILVSCLFMAGAFFSMLAVAKENQQRLSLEEMSNVQGGGNAICCAECHGHGGGIIHCTGCTSCTVVIISLAE